ncbi:MAG: polyphosphate polymerase domain-containing protein [Clostridia bacterium]|nr:polyphosphate polymerase domain-containing protein [Clostridia bacterium]
MKFRHEYKHQINRADMLILQTRLGAIMKHDSHCGGDGTYFVKSLYFDNYLDKALREKIDGVDKREKFRIRYYGTDTSFMRLEKKSKINGMCNKEHVLITVDECRRIIDGDTDFLMESEHNLFRELYAKMKYQLLRPKCIVAYNRECFVHPLGNVRVTLDYDICGSSNISGFLNPDLSFLQLYHTSILEVKWDEYLPQLVRDAVQLKNRRTAAFSKYAAVRF